MHSASAWNWPPVWTHLTRDGGILHGEVGTLQKVVRKDFLDGKCLLVIEHENGRYVGSLIFDDIMFCRLIFAVLTEHIGRPIKEIGDLDLSYTL